MYSTLEQENVWKRFTRIIIVEGEIKSNNNGKKGRGVVETAPVTRFEREGGGGRKSKLTTNLFAAKQAVSEGNNNAKQGVSAGGGIATQLAVKTRAANKQKSNKAKDEDKAVPADIGGAVTTTGSGGQQATPVK